MKHKPVRDEEKGSFCVIVENWYQCPKCKFKSRPTSLDKYEEAE